MSGEVHKFMDLSTHLPTDERIDPAIFFYSSTETSALKPVESPI